MLARPSKVHGVAVGALAALGGVLASSMLPACTSGGSRPRDVAGDRRVRRAERDASAEASATDHVPEPPPSVVRPVTTSARPRLFARASARALALDATRVYYGDSEDDGVYAKPKIGGDAVRLSRHAPVAGALAVDGATITWIASPGDAVLRIGLDGAGQPTTLRDRGIFSDVAVSGAEVFITEAIGAGGALLRVTGPSAARIASFEGAPRAVLADATHAYVITPTRIFRTPHLKGDLDTIATGTAFASPQMDDGNVYVVAEIAGARVVARVPKAGGAVTTLARDVRDAPIEVEGGEVLYFDATRPQIRAVPAGGGDSRVVVEDDALTEPSAIVTDPATVYVATGSRESGAIVAVDRRPSRAAP